MAIKRIAVLLMVCAFIAGWSASGYCQAESASEDGMERSEDEISNGLGAEISADQAQSEAGVEEVEFEMDSGRPAE